MPHRTQAQNSDASIIEMRDISIGFTARAGSVIRVLKDINLTVRRGESVGLVGESGSGKSTLALAAMGYLKHGLRLISGQVTFEGQDMFALEAKGLAAIRGGQAGPCAAKLGSVPDTDAAHRASVGRGAAPA